MSVARKILHIVLSIGETNTTFNEHCLPVAATRGITLCTFFNPTLRVPPAITVFEGGGTLVGFVRALRAALGCERYDVIHAHTPHVAFLFLIVTLLHARELWPSAIVTVHSSYSVYSLRNRSLFLPVFAAFGRVVCCSRSSFDSFPLLYRRLAGRRLASVPNGVDLARVDRVAASRAQSRGNLNQHFKVVSIGRLDHGKNPFTVLRAFHAADQSGSTLCYIGEGPLRQVLLTACSNLKLDGQVAVTGLLPRESVFEHLLDADLFISASRGEGLPVAVLEAMACGCPVLLSDIPPHREIVGDADCIPLLDPDDITGFACEITRFRAMSKSDRLGVGAECRRLVEQRFSLEAMHAGYEAIYAGISRFCEERRHTAGIAHAR